MNPRSILKVIAIMASGMALFVGHAISQQRSLKEQLIGTWSLVSVADVYENGNEVNDWGPTVGGAASFDADGRFTWMVIGANLPTPTGSPRISGRMVIAYYGKYTFDEATKTITYTAERATFPSFDGGIRKASVILNGDEMTQYSTPIVTPKGTMTPQFVFKRAK